METVPVKMGEGNQPGKACPPDVNDCFRESCSNADLISIQELGWMIAAMWLSMGQAHPLGIL